MACHQYQGYDAVAAASERAHEPADIIRMFGAEVILLWSALIMKKRVAVYCEKLPILLKFVRCVDLLLRRRSACVDICATQRPPSPRLPSPKLELPPTIRYYVAVAGD